ncbi:PREDICTED: LOW QUALITY PROTEIN: C-type lectin domain family 4 member A [Odobenus rosmarus divergens]|uniref:LOW QUALITY PROTEIN: C-type lectin domain family 4 member A n=1 Tax=Odobenus rosmarus divergens TaxID=9708 RepID=A0A2U3WG53_ODORO|nr:PREDICTED: LOW QUALITY PROTEIN: C-type lectin domain family 4 member A [Odobenus rosmarus divergens]
MTSETTYAELSFKNESKSSSTKSWPPAAPKEKTSPHKSNPSFPKLLFASLLVLLLLLTISFFIAFIKKDWSCFPKAWKSFSSNCYFISTITRNWTESERNCSEMKAHLLVINTKDEQNFIFQNLDTYSTYYIGLSNPKGKRDWKWVDQTSYNESVTFWHLGEPSNLDEGCVMLHFCYLSRKWGWNNVPCNGRRKSICKMMKIYL